MKNRIIIQVPLLMLMTVSCTWNYLEKNSNPYEVSKEQMATDGYDVGSAMSKLCGTVVPIDVNTAQFTDCLLGGPMGGYYSTTGAFANTIDNFNATDNWTDVFMTNSNIIPTLYTNLKELERLTDDASLLAMAKIVKVAAMHRVTDTYGPIPYTKIGEGGALKVPYDSQKTVYDGLFKELDEAIAVLSENIDALVSANADPVYGGSIRKWCKFANSLKLRLAMRIVYADKAEAQRMAEEAVNHAVGVFTSNEDNASLKPVAFGEKGNPLYNAVKYNQVRGSNTGGDSHAAAEITSYMNAYDDPRRPSYFIESEFEGDALKYVGALISAEKPPLGTVGRKYAGIRLSPSDPLVWMNAAEVAFLKAEAKAVFGFDMGGNAETFYNEGIRLSFSQWGASGYEDYKDNDSPVSVSYANPPGGENRSEVLSVLPVKWDEGADLKEKQERIMIQKWIANWHIGNEGWADHRRTGYPKFFSASDAGNKSQGVVDNNLGARRMPYPQSEVTNNPENYRQACDVLLCGKDNYATRIWWDCNPDIK